MFILLVDFILQLANGGIGDKMVSVLKGIIEIVTCMMKIERHVGDLHAKACSYGEVSSMLHKS
jgi:hypothetical protein